MLKRRVRRVKEEHKLKEENERLRLMVQEMLAQERSRSNSASMCVFLSFYTWHFYI